MNHVTLDMGFLFVSFFLLREAEWDWSVENVCARAGCAVTGRSPGVLVPAVSAPSLVDECSGAGSRAQSLSPSLRWSSAPSLHREPTADRNYPSPAPAPPLNKHAVQLQRAAAYPSHRISACFARPVKLKVFS